MRIEDDELRNLFKTTGEERIQAIDNGLLHLEKYSDDAAVLDSILREAHSLKGDSNMLGQSDMGSLAHQIEHLLTATKQGKEPFTPDLFDRLAQGMEAIRKLLHHAVTGEPAGVDAFHVLATLMGAAPEPASQPQESTLEASENGTADITEETKEAPDSSPGKVDASETNQAEGAETNPDEGNKKPETAEDVDDATNTILFETRELNVPPAALPQSLPIPNSFNPQHLAAQQIAPQYRIETVRVPTQTLDHLMTQAGELTVTQIRVAHRLSEVEEIANLWEEWSRDLFVNRFLFDESQSRQTNARQLSQFYARAESHVEQLGKLVNRLRTAMYEDTTRLEGISDELAEGIRTLRLLPLSTMFNLFPRLVRDLARQEDKQVELVMEGSETRADKRILEEMKDPLMHMIRNTIDHGIELPCDRKRLGKSETATIWLRGYQTPTHVIIEVEDDGQGLNVESIKETALRRGLYRADELASLTDSQLHALVLSPGFSTRTMVTEISGRGVGLDVLRSNVERLKGSIEIESTPGKGCLMRIRLSTTLATAHVLIVTVQGQTFALPVEAVQTACLVHAHDLFQLEGRQTLIYEGQPVSVCELADLLELPAVTASKGQSRNDAARPCVILSNGDSRLGIFVDALIDEQDVMLKPQSKLLKRVRNVSGSTILGTGEVCMVLNPADLIQSVRRQAVAIAHPNHYDTTAPTQYSVLLVEDSIATRIQEKRILEAAGYAVTTAVDGLDGYNKLQARLFDAVISDVQMPHMSGLELTRRIRQHREYSEVPVILVTTLASDADRQRGAEAGANAYITKGSFNQDILDTLHRLI
ncbi:MAG: hybrid sensor histidine kinase/response regulator [Thainema sp.]